MCAALAQWSQRLSGLPRSFLFENMKKRFLLLLLQSTKKESPAHDKIMYLVATIRVIGVNL